MKWRGNWQLRRKKHDKPSFLPLEPGQCNSQTIMRDQNPVGLWASLGLVLNENDPTLQQANKWRNPQPL